MHIPSAPRHWCRSVAIVGALVCLFGVHSSMTIAATPQQVEQAITKAKAYLYSQLNNDNWEKAGSRNTGLKPQDASGGQWGGTTALATYALLAAGESSQEPRLAKAIEFLRTNEITGTYAVALRAQVWLNIPKNKQIQEAIEKDTKLLLLGRKTAGPNKGFYDYLNSGLGGRGDHSCGQYGVLGIWACSDSSELINDSYWDEVDHAWRLDQGTDGSWSYQGRPGESVPLTDRKGKVTQSPPEVSSLAMTAAGVATLFITQDFVYRGRGLECTGNITDKNIDAGLKWIAAHYNEADNPYEFYGMERIGVASGYKYIGDVDWYQRSADFVLTTQQADGSIANKKWSKFVQGWGPVVNTSFSLLFLARGREPVMMNKLDYSADGPDQAWNQRARDVANIARWVGRQIENNLNWQITNLSASPDEWHDAPILYIGGAQPLKFSTAEKAKLKTFVEQGGLILGNADCARKEFSDSFQALGTELFGRKFAPLAADSIIFHDEQFNASKWRRKPTVLAMDNGARQLMLLLPDTDPGKAWQFQQSAGKEELFQLAANIFLYAVDKNNLSKKGETYIVEPDPARTATGKIEVCRLKFDGNWDPEPGGWRRISAIMHNQDGLDVTTTAVDPAKPLSLAAKKIAYLTGTGPCKVGTAAVDGIKQFIKAGGTLVVDAAGGNTVFAASMDDLLPVIFGEDAKQLKTPLPADDPLFAIGGPMPEFMYRNYARTVLGGARIPRIRAIKIGSRIACVYSAEDLSVGLVGQPVDGILGYQPPVATELVRKILLYTSGAKFSPPPPAAAAKSSHRKSNVSEPDKPIFTPAQ